MNYEFEKDPTLARDEEERVLVDSSLKKALSNIQENLKRKVTRRKIKPLIEGHGRHI